MTTKKSASKFKIAEPKTEITKEEAEAQLQKILDNGKITIGKSIKIQIDQVTRFDSLLAIHDSYVRFGFDGCDIDTARRVADVMKSKLEEIAEAIDGIDFETMVAKDYSNPIDSFVPVVGDGCGWEEVLDAALVFSAIRPWGENIDNIHQQIISKAYEIGYYEDEE